MTEAGFFLIQEQLAIATWLVVVKAAILISRNVHVTNEYFPIFEYAIGFHDTGLAVPYRLNLSTGQLNTRDKLILEVILEARFFILYVDLILHLLKTRYAKVILLFNHCELNSLTFAA